MIAEHAALADVREERRRLPSHAELPVDLGRRRPPTPDDPGMHRVQMVRGAHGDPIGAFVPAAAAAIQKMMVVQVPA